MRFSRQEDWSGLPCPPPGDLPDPGLNRVSSVAGAFFTSSATEKPYVTRWALVRGEAREVFKRLRFSMSPWAGEGFLVSQVMYQQRSSLEARLFLAPQVFLEGMELPLCSSRG